MRWGKSLTGPWGGTEAFGLALGRIAGCIVVLQINRVERDFAPVIGIFSLSKWTMDAAHNAVPVLIPLCGDLRAPQLRLRKEYNLVWKSGIKSVPKHFRSKIEVTFCGCTNMKYWFAGEEGVMQQGESDEETLIRHDEFFGMATPLAENEPNSSSLKRRRKYWT